MVAVPTLLPLSMLTMVRARTWPSESTARTVCAISGLAAVATRASLRLMPLVVPATAFLALPLPKAFALAGGRVGYLAASRQIVDALRVVRLPYRLSAVTQAVARAALAHSDELLAQVGALRAERDNLVGRLRGQGFTVADSDANFVLFGVFPDRHAVWQGLLDRGVLIREVGPAGWLRVSVGTPGETAAFRAALTEVVGL